MGKKILCGKFGQKLKNNFAVGDQDNNLIVYNVTSPKPITVLNPQISNSVSSLTSLTFTQSDDLIVVGSSRGSINIWDLNSLKINYCLKGHTVQVCSLYSDKKYDNLIVSGSSDTNAKVWDLRTKNCQHNIKNHNKRITALTIGTESRLLVTGGEDGIVQTFDLRMMRPVFQYQINSPVLCADLNESNYLAIGSMDRLARIYNAFPPFHLYGCTKNQTMPISSVVFYQNKYLFIGGTDNLKVYSLDGQLVMTDNIQTSSKGILNMSVDDKIQQIAYSGGTLSYHVCYLSDVNLKGPYIYTNQSVSIQKLQKIDDAIQKNNKISVKITNNNPTNHITNQKTKALLANRSNSIAKQLSGVAQNINDVLNNIKKASQEFSNKKIQSNQLRQMMNDDHGKFIKIMGQRAKSIQNILDLWMKGNIKVLIQQLKSLDIYVVSDVLSQILKPSKINISVQFGVIIAERSKQMINNKHLTLIKMGIQYMLQVVSLFKDDMIKLKTFGSDKGVDLAREQRLRKFDQLIQQFIEVYQSHRLKRLAQKKDETSKLAQKLSSQFTLIFKKVYGNDYQG